MDFWLGWLETRDFEGLNIISCSLILEEEHGSGGSSFKTIQHPEQA